MILLFLLSFESLINKEMVDQGSETWNRVHDILCDWAVIIGNHEFSPGVLQMPRFNGFAVGALQ